jgi:hypothetical protein
MTGSFKLILHDCQNLEPMTQASTAFLYILFSSQSDQHHTHLYSGALYANGSTTYYWRKKGNYYNCVLFTNYMELTKLTFAQLVKKFPAFYGPPKFHYPSLYIFQLPL